ncbi:MAG: TraR/DksA C4-type zinc finger protein [Kiritimatiellia bacterium]
MDEVDIANEYLARRYRAWEVETRNALSVQPEDGPDRCIDCDCLIPPARKQAVPGCVRCVQCQQEHDDG